MEFKCTSAEPYDKHHYILHLDNGKRMLFFDYSELKNYWYFNENAVSVEVTDKTSKGGGFKGK